MTRRNLPAMSVVIPHLDGKAENECPRIPSSRIPPWNNDFGPGSLIEYYASKGAPETVNIPDRSEEHPMAHCDHVVVETGNYDDDIPDELSAEEELTIYDPADYDEDT